MKAHAITRSAHIGFPRFFNIGGFWINSYKVFLIIGIYVASLTSAAVAQSVGRSPLRVGLAAMACALFGLIGARVYHVLVHAPGYLTARSRHLLWAVERGGWSVFGGLLTLVPASLGIARVIAVPVADLWDYMSAGVLAGGTWIRLGCVFNGCCAGREMQGFPGVRLHDVHGSRKVRIPVQFFEIAWWLLGGGVFLALWPTVFARASYALGVLAWYGFGRFFLEPMREEPDVVFRRVRIDQVVAGLLALGAASALVVRSWHLPS
jgi:phosphatidylglycerol:prolipoprotein diacylglycerol transferase